MRPRNKFEKEIVRLSKLLRPLTKPQLKWINNEAFEHYAYVKKHTTECLDCNHIWNNNGDLICPICKHGREAFVPLNEYKKDEKTLSPKKETSPAEEKYICTVCGYIHTGPIPDDIICPVCKHGREAFVPYPQE